MEFSWRSIPVIRMADTNTVGSVKGFGYKHTNKIMWEG
jgi:hypothetical protein